MTNPGDGKDHAWGDVVDNGLWKSRCPEGVIADPAELTEPEDEFGRCQGCIIALGARMAERLGDTTWKA